MSRTPASGTWMTEFSPKPAATVSKAVLVSAMLGTVRRIAEQRHRAEHGAHQLRSEVGRGVQRA